jgi:hypothetical protein
MPQDPQSKRLESIAKIVLTIVFLGLIGVLAAGVERKAGWVKITNITVFDFILLVLATTRLGRMIAFDRIMDPFRMPFTRVVEDNSGEGKTVIPRGNGFRQAIGQLISCPICVGTWAAALLTAALLVFPDGTRVFLYALGAVSAAEIMHSLIEKLCWGARQDRVNTGQLMQQKKIVQDEHALKDAHSQQ